jgi:hypothetical protein
VLHAVIPVDIPVLSKENADLEEFASKPALLGRGPGVFLRLSFCDPTHMMNLNICVKHTMEDMLLVHRFSGSDY